MPCMNSPRQKCKKIYIIRNKEVAMIFKNGRLSYLHYRPISRWDLGNNRARCW